MVQSIVSCQVRSQGSISIVGGIAGKEAREGEPGEETMPGTNEHFLWKFRKARLWNGFRDLSLTSLLSVVFQGSAGDDRNPFPGTSLPNEDKTRRPQV